jgi:hypothetical protein
MAGDTAPSYRARTCDSLPRNTWLAIVRVVLVSSVMTRVIASCFIYVPCYMYTIEVRKSTFESNVYKGIEMVKELLISARVSAEVKARLESAASDERRSLSNYVALVLERHIAALPSSPNRSTEAALDSMIARIGAAAPHEPNIGEPVRRHTVIPLDEPIRAPEGPVGVPQSRRDLYGPRRPSVKKRRQRHHHDD